MDGSKGWNLEVGAVTGQVVRRRRMDYCDGSAVGRSAGPVIILEATLTKGRK